jgi:methylenetetrahydrofolate dehydrogenase (NADP+)/methenyltetrahydrofolate cyclohydrolase
MVTASILDGKKIALQIREEIRERVAQFTSRTGVTPTLAAVLVGNDPASRVYVKNKRRASQQAGIASRLHLLPADGALQDVLTLVGRLNADPDIHAILIQLPLPAHMAASDVLDSVHPLKDVDGLHPENVGLLFQGRPRFHPCTPFGIQHLLQRSGIEVAGKHVVIVGRSEIVGKPLAAMLMQRTSALSPSVANATVTLCHSKTRNLPVITRMADVLIVAVGHPRMVTAEMVRPGAVVIDVGINRTDGGLVGDVDFDLVVQVASHITPVPGGIGPLTVAMVLENTLRAAELQVGR